MKKELKRLTKIEEELKDVFSKAVLVLLNSSNPYRRNQVLQDLSEAIETERIDLRLWEYSFPFLIQLQHYFEEKISYNFMAIYNQEENFDTQFRLYGHILQQYMTFLQNHPFLIEKETKEIYFHALLQFHYGKSFKEIYALFEGQHKSLDYCWAYFRLLYSFPGLEAAPLSFPKWDVFLKDYDKYEKETLWKEFQCLLKQYQVLEEEEFLAKLENLYSSSYYLVLLNMLFSYVTFEEIEEEIDFTISSRAKRIFLKDLAKIYFPKDTRLYLLKFKKNK